MKAALILSSWLFASIAAAVDTTALFEVNDGFRESKNIAFIVMSGGASHANWVLAFMEELSAHRGHKTYFVTRDDHVKFGHSFPSVETVSIGPKYAFDNKKIEVIKKMRDRPMVESFIDMFSSFNEEFESDYTSIVSTLKSKRIDLAICDHFCTPCVEASTKLKIPFIITSGMALGPDAGAPYINNNMLTMSEPSTLNMSLWQRFDIMFLKPAHFIYKLRHFAKQQHALFTSLGIEDPVNVPEDRWKDSLKIVNSAFGFELARPLGPLVELVGPITTTKAPPLTGELTRFMETHSKVAYIAFGQHVVISPKDIKLLLTGLLEAYEAKELNGIIWATRGLEDEFPAILTTASNTTYSIQSFFQNKGNTDIAFINWAPQIAILNHPATSMFITHGGAGSLYESLNAGVPVVVFPFFGDQPVAAKNAEKNGFGMRLEYTEPQERATEIIRTVARDQGNRFRENVKRFQTLVQLNNKIGVTKAATLVEEVLFMHQDGQLLHRRDCLLRVPWD
ncbi:UDP-glucosyl transferase family protein [Mucor ambiguus]|uniref:UDP-glucosyl transferase family protein n=1 Tax=Mucor ambiguus TaxID=91626 RepID=A0A0C9LVI5_9FUNG|nr:UDP-glucosyl transferase family protein [Mucor ambiguus]